MQCIVFGAKKDIKERKKGKPKFKEKRRSHWSGGEWSKIQFTTTSQNFRDNNFSLTQHKHNVWMDGSINIYNCIYFIKSDEVVSL
jgi:hypothetical protein